MSQQNTQEEPLHMAPAPISDQPFRFLDLHPEIRNSIYHCLLFRHGWEIRSNTSCMAPKWVPCDGIGPCGFVGSDNTMLCQYYDDTGSAIIPGASKGPSLSLLSVCHQIHSEATSIFYATNTFTFSDFDDVGLWLNRIGYRHQQLLTSIRIVYPYGDKLCNVKSTVEEVYGIYLLSKSSGIRTIYFGGQIDWALREDFVDAGLFGKVLGPLLETLLLRWNVDSRKVYEMFRIQDHMLCKPCQALTKVTEQCVDCRRGRRNHDSFMDVFEYEVFYTLEYLCGN